jgi:hypothetical protein
MLICIFRCNQYYIGQTGRTFNIRYKERIGLRDMRNNEDKTGYAQVLNTGHTYGNIHDTMEIIQAINKRTNDEYNRKIPHTQSN